MYDKRYPNDCTEEELVETIENIGSQITACSEAGYDLIAKEHFCLLDDLIRKYHDWYVEQRN